MNKEVKEIIDSLEQTLSWCDRITTGNLPHNIANLKQCLVSTIELLKVLNLGWHPANELPVIPEGKNWVKVIALVDYGDNTLRPRHEIYKDKGWSKKDMWDVKWRCYQPQNN